MIAAKRISTGQVTPFSNLPRGVHIAPLDDTGYYYAFNFDEPCGVKLLKGSIAARLLELTKGQDSVPQIPSFVRPEDSILANHKFLIVQGNYSLYRSRAAPLSRSFNVWLHVVNGCNFRCFYCYIPHLKAHIDPSLINQHSMSEDTARAVIDRLLAFCRRNSIPRLHVKFAGGEPTLNLTLVKSFCSIATAASGDVHISFGIISNGSFLVDEIEPILARYDIKLSISIDGFEESHDQIRFSMADDQHVGSWNESGPHCLDQFLPEIS